MSKQPALVQFGNLKREHFEAFPVWASCHSFDYDEDWFDETDEETFRPWAGRLPVDPDAGTFLIRCSITLRNGTVLRGFITPQSGGATGLEMGAIQPHLFLPDGSAFGFWFGMTAPLIESRNKFYRALNRSASEVFPALFTAEPGLSSGDQVGEIAGFYWTPDLRVLKVET